MRGRLNALRAADALMGATAKVAMTAEELEMDRGGDAGDGAVCTDGGGDGAVGIYGGRDKAMGTDGAVKGDGNGWRRSGWVRVVTEAV